MRPNCKSKLLLAGRCLPCRATFGVARVTVQLTQAGELAAKPEVESGFGQNKGFEMLSKSAIRAIQRCAPYPGLAKLAPYGDWRKQVIDFSPPQP